jgi:hypothetical protein
VRGEDKNVTIKLMNDGNSFVKGEDIKLHCEFKINTTVNNVTLNFKEDMFYFHDSKNSSSMF